MDKKQLTQYLNKNSMDIARSYATLFFCDLVFEQYSLSGSVVKINTSPIFCYASFDKLKSFYQIIPESIIFGVAEKIYQDYLKNSKSFAKKMSEQKLLQVNIEKNWQRYLKFIKNARQWWRYGMIGEDKGEYLRLEIAPKLAVRHNLDLKKAEEILNKISHPGKQSYFNRARISFLKICLLVASNRSKNIAELLDDDKIKAEINYYLKNFFWIDSDFYQAQEIKPDSLIKDALQELKNKSENTVADEFKSILRNYNKIESQKKSLIKKIKLTAADKTDIYYAQQFVQWIDDRKAAYMTQFYNLLIMFRDFVKINRLNYDKTALYLLDELGDLFKNNKTVNDKILSQRHNGVFFVYVKNKPRKEFYGPTAEKFLTLATKTSTSQIKGVVASAGGQTKIEGKAKIIFQPNSEKFLAGEILVTSMTRVEFVPLMRKAKAVITDEGGVGCHAAVVSRELGIPCIVGTKNATKLIKNGAQVEMDLKTGQIKILI